MNIDREQLTKQILSGERVEIPDAMKRWLAEPKRLFIGQRWCDGKLGKTFRTVNPATEASLADVAVAEREDAELAVSEARASFARGEWARMPLPERARIVRRIGDKILEHRAPLALLESLDTGKPIRESYDGDIPRAAQNFHFFSEFALSEESLYFPNAGDVHFAFREPLGVVVLITPWNLPLYLESWKLAPALLMGNSVILKPSEVTPLTATYLTELMQDVGLPPGVFGLVHGFGEKSAGEFLTSHPGIDGISFTGETSTGRAIMRAAAAGPTRVSFELGGKGASLVFADADLDTAVEETCRAAFRNQGEICLCCPRIFVEKSKYDVFLEKYLNRVKQIRVGDPLCYDTTMGALVSEDHWKKVTGYLDQVPSGKIQTGGKRPAATAKGYFLEPTVITGLGLDHPISREEVFGPVVSIYPFSTEDEVIAAANDTPYGLSASIWTSHLDRANRVAARLHAGLVWVNCWFVRDLRVPFGGQKRSGVGREGGKHSLDFFSEWKSVCIKQGR